MVAIFGQKKPWFEYIYHTFKFSYSPPKGVVFITMLVRRYMAEILPIRRKTPYNQSIILCWLYTLV